MLICPKCGAKSTDKDFLEAFCIDCYPFNVKLPKTQTLAVCKKCKKMRLKGEWCGYNRRKIGDWMVSKLRGEFSSADYDIDNCMAIITVEKNGKTAKIKREMKLELETIMCQNCNKIAGGYFQAKIQLRGDEKRVEKYKRIFESMLSKKTFIGKEKEMHGGIDIYVGSSKAVFEVMAELGLRAKITRKLFGKSEGKRIYRTSFAIRFD